MVREKKFGGVVPITHKHSNVRQGHNGPTAPAPPITYIPTYTRNVRTTTGRSASPFRKAHFSVHIGGRFWGNVGSLKGALWDTEGPYWCGESTRRAFHSDRPKSMEFWA